MYPERLSKLRQKMKEHSIDSFLITNLVNIKYLSGFDGEGALLLCDGVNYLISDARYLCSLDKYSEEFEVIVYKESLLNVLRKLLDKGVSLGVEAENLTMRQADALRRELKVDVVGLDNLVNQLRLFKDDVEIECIKRACNAAIDIFLQILRQIAKISTEYAFSVELEYYIRNSGYELSFSPIVAGGKRTAIPHHKPTTEKLDNPLIIDFGLKFSHYNCDITRTIFLHPNDKLIHILEDIKSLRMELFKKIKPNISSVELDMYARKYFSDSGYDSAYIKHNLGHGIGLDVHEPPYLAYYNEPVEIKKNMVFTIEPGIYIDGLGGVRIEDVVVVTDDGCEVLSLDLPTDVFLA